MSVIQCCSKTEFYTRCTNTCIGRSNHCHIHYDTSKKLYDKYKFLSEYAKTINIHKEFSDISERYEYISQSHVVLVQTFFARLNHRDYAFAPECYDEGHDYQFIMLQKKIKECGELLNDLKQKVENNAFLKKKSSDVELSITVSKHIIDTPLSIGNIMPNKLLKIGMAHNIHKHNRLIKILLKTNNKSIKNDLRLLKRDKPKSNKIVGKLKTEEWVLKINNPVKLLESKVDVIKKELPIIEIVTEEANSSGKKYKLNKKKKKKVEQKKVETKKVEKKVELKLKKIVKQKNPVNVTLHPKIILPPKIINQILKLFNTNTDDDVYILCNLAKHIIQQLDMINFFESDFEPLKCECNECDKYLSYSVTIDCDCFCNYRTAEDYFKCMKKKTLIRLYEILLLFAKKLIPLLSDIKKIYRIFGLNVFFIPLLLVWNDDEKKYYIGQMNKDEYEANCSYDDSDSDSDNGYAEEYDG